MMRLTPRMKTRLVAAATLPALLFFATGCATIVRGTTETVTVVTNPPGATLYYEGMFLHDGDMVTVRKDFDTPKFNVGESRRPILVDMSYDPEVWIVGDAAWLLFGIIPGLIAGGIDVGTGAWRDLDQVQLINVPAKASIAVEGKRIDGPPLP